MADAATAGIVFLYNAGLERSGTACAACPGATRSEPAF